jgi:hypothetical protein
MEHPEIAEHNWIDDIFRLEQTRWNTWKSFTKDGKEVITALHEDGCILATRQYLKWRQEGFPETKNYDGTVGGKL